MNIPEGHLLYNHVGFRIRPSEDWIQGQIPKVVLDGVKGLKDEFGDSVEMDSEAVVKAYVNIVAGACISLGMCSIILRINHLNMTSLQSCVTYIVIM